MKKILVAALALFIAAGAFAQENPLTFGVQAGLNISQFSAGKYDGEKGKASDMLTGFYIGGHANYSLGEYFGIQGELKFSMQGGKNSEEDSGDKYETKISLGYINIPILFEVKPVENFSIFVGPQIGFNATKGASLKVNGATAPDPDVEVKALDLAAVVGVQYAIGGKYLLSARYNVGFTSVSKDSDVSGLENRVIQIGVGYKF